MPFHPCPCPMMSGPTMGMGMGMGMFMWPVVFLLELAVGLAVLGLIVYVGLRLVGLRPADVVRELRRDYIEVKKELKRE